MYDFYIDLNMPPYLITILIVVPYFIIIGGFIIGYTRVKLFNLKNSKTKTAFSIVIPFRNEANCLPRLLDSILKLNYPKHLFEIIFVDDASEDDSVKIVSDYIISNKNLAAKLINNARVSNSPKKDALTTAIKQAKHDWIITTDADCVLPSQWLSSFNAFIENNNTAISIAAPVHLENQPSFLNHFQILDVLSLQGVTTGAFGLKKPFLCNGANFAYQKTVFKALNGFNGNNSIASGDDVFLLEKIARTFPDQAHYLKCKDAIVTTPSEPTWSDLISQRLRWAKKATAYTSLFAKATALFVFLINALIVLCFILVCINQISLLYLIYIYGVKFMIDGVLIYKSAMFFNQKNSLKSYPLSALVYPFFSTYIVILSFFKKYTWKGREFKV